LPKVVLWQLVYDFNIGLKEVSHLLKVGDEFILSVIILYIIIQIGDIINSCKSA